MWLLVFHSVTLPPVLVAVFWAIGFVGARNSDLRKDLRQCLAIPWHIICPFPSSLWHWLDQNQSTIPGLCWNSLLPFEISSRDFLLLCNLRSLIKYYVWHSVSGTLSLQRPPMGVLELLEWQLVLDDAIKATSQVRVAIKHILKE